MKHLISILSVLFVLILGLSSCTKQSVVPGDDFFSPKVNKDIVLDDEDENNDGSIDDDDGIEIDGDGITDDEDDEDDDDGGAARNADATGEE